MSLSIVSGLILFILISFTRRFIKSRRKFGDVVKLSGPPPGSWLMGNMPTLLRPEEVGDADFSWTRKYGTVFRMMGTFGRDNLFVSDPKALRYILNTRGYRFSRSQSMRFLAQVISGKSLIWAEVGDQHARQRKIMEPAFSHASVAAFLPVFQEKGHIAIDKWRDTISQNGGNPVVLDVHSWLARLTLDAIGAAMDYELGSLEGNSENQLAKEYENLFSDSQYNQGDGRILFMDLVGYLPEWAIHLIRNSPDANSKRLKKYLETANHVSRTLILSKLSLLAAGKDTGKDIMSLLVNANQSKEVSTEELIAQLTGLLVAGHETTASTMAWLLYELSRNQDLQDKLRKDIAESQRHRGSEELTTQAFESMPLLQAILKETLRYHPILARTIRTAGQDDVIPLSVPHKTADGKILNEVAVEKGQQIIISFAAYNRLTSIWGEDAHIWNPERFLNDNETTKTGLGVISNIITFGSGERSCIGWRFALLEMQSMLCDLISNFKFSPPPGNVQIIRSESALMMPM
ncbi:hypothetical protein M422DRAFT_253061 [Sphaerobolus stellatus SS14]|uniref:Cytochrome P450 n=1 Tax=Sphaerobolus stellatus (strain SS14) TaxID=990650 RepID=A0A0C9V948_SPHS4|nr:hypothetical protein M422DRAFT_253061 [Sphaerobolus stellatus SS14]